MNTNYFLNCVAGNVFNTKADPELPTSYYIGLSSALPNVDGSGVAEPIGAGYARVKLEGLSEPVDGVITNNEAINFPESGLGGWGTITHFVIYDSPEGGNLLMYGELSVTRVIEEATIMTIKANDLKLSIQNPV